MDLKATGDAEQRIEKALRSPLHQTGLDYADQPLADVVTQLAEEYGIPIHLNKTALEEAGIGTDSAGEHQLAQHFAALGAATDAQEPAAHVHHSR